MEKVAEASKEPVSTEEMLKTRKPPLPLFRKFRKVFFANPLTPEYEEFYISLFEKIKSEYRNLPGFGTMTEIALERFAMSYTLLKCIEGEVGIRPGTLVAAKGDKVLWYAGAFKNAFDEFLSYLKSDDVIEALAKQAVEKTKVVDEREVVGMVFRTIDSLVSDKELKAKLLKEIADKVRKLGKPPTE